MSTPPGPPSATPTQPIGKDTPRHYHSTADVTYQLGDLGTARDKLQWDIGSGRLQRLQNVILISDRTSP
jgi:hypothetical protein